jgi:hypothetical protein
MCLVIYNIQYEEFSEYTPALPLIDNHGREFYYTRQQFTHQKLVGAEHVQHVAIPDADGALFRQYLLFRYSKRVKRIIPR